MTTQVVIAGGGPAGLALAIELGRRGIACVVVEPQRAASLEEQWRLGSFASPRAKLTNIRTMEHLRRWGIAERLRAAAPMPRNFPQRVIFTTRLNADAELARFEDAFGLECGDPGTSPEGPQQCPQFVLESVLRDHARTLPACVLRLGERVTSFVQHDGGVTVQTLDEEGSCATIEARYLAGCDGSRSAVRASLGIALAGEHGFSSSLSVVFRSADLVEHIAHPPAIHYWIVNPEAPGIAGPLGRGFWWMMFTAGEFRAGVPAPEEVRRLIAAAVGAPIAYEVVDVAPWFAHSLIADRYREGNVFLLGDAAHLHPPTGGHGMNMAIGDAVDLGWKLAATLQGWGGPALLDSYQTERRTVHERVIGSAVSNWSAVANRFVAADLEAPTEAGRAARRRIGAEIERTKREEFRSLGLVLGYHYGESPIVARDGTPPPPEAVDRFTPTARPGSRAPHRWLADASSLYDHFGDGFTLLALGPAAPATLPLEHAARERNVPLHVARRADPGLRELYEAALVLVRPDQHVAWRGDELPAGVDALLSLVCGAAPVPSSHELIV